MFVPKIKGQTSDLYGEPTTNPQNIVSSLQISQRSVFQQLPLQGNE